jgi:hypothetical protein
MRRLFAVLLVPLVVLVGSARASADTILFANLTNSQEVPPVVPTTSTGAPRLASFGTATFTLNDAQTALTLTASIFNIDVTGSQTADINDNLAAAHIHASALAVPGVNAGVVWGFFGTPFNETNPNDVVVLPFPIGFPTAGGIFFGKWDLTEGNNTTLAAQLPFILGGTSYINFHTTQFGGGEIRGQISVVPEPSTMLLVALPAAGLIRRRWRQRHGQV